MRNFIGGLLGVFIGSIVIVITFTLTMPSYPKPFDLVWFLLIGSYAIQTTLFSVLTPLNLVLYILTWCIIGLVIGIFSKPGWNTVRSAVWVGLIFAIFALISLLLLDPEFWNSTTRNFDLLSQFAVSLILSMLALPSAFLTSIIMERLRQQAEPPIPTKIETVCECGAIFKSNPLICSECGRILNKKNL